MPRGAAAAAANAKRAAQDEAAQRLEEHNAKTALAFRKQVAAFCAANEDRDIINRFASGNGKDQTLFELSQRKSDGMMFFYEAYGPIKNFPRSARLKRAGNPLEREDEEDVEAAAEQGRAADDSGVDVDAQPDREGTAIPHDWETEEARRAEAMQAAQAKAAAAGRKIKRAKTTATSASASAPRRNTREGSSEPTRRSTRVAAGARRSCAPAGTIREDQEEHHVGNYGAGLARGQDDLASLLNGLEGCEIKSEMGSESTVIHSRDGSVALMV